MKKDLRRVQKKASLSLRPERTTKKAPRLQKRVKISSKPRVPSAREMRRMKWRLRGSSWMKVPMNLIWKMTRFVFRCTFLFRMSRAFTPFGGFSFFGIILC